MAQNDTKQQKQQSGKKATMTAAIEVSQNQEVYDVRRPGQECHHHGRARNLHGSFAGGNAFYGVRGPKLPICTLESQANPELEFVGPFSTAEEACESVGMDPPQAPESEPAVQKPKPQRAPGLCPHCKTRIDGDLVAVLEKVDYIACPGCGEQLGFQDVRGRKMEDQPAQG